MAVRFFKYSDIMHKLILILTLIVVTGTFTSCNNNRIENAVRSTLGKTISMPYEVQDSTIRKFTIIRYLDNPVCTSCQLHMGEWRIYRRQVQRTYGDSINFVFIISTKNPVEAKSILSMYKFDRDAIIGDNLSFCKDNGLTEDLGKDFVLLIDADKRIVSIGNPWESQKAAENFNRFFSGKVSTIRLPYIK